MDEQPVKKKKKVRQLVKEQAKQGLKKRNFEEVDYGRSESGTGTSAAPDDITIQNSTTDQTPVQPPRRGRRLQEKAEWVPAPQLPAVTDPAKWQTLKVYAEERQSSCSTFFERSEKRGPNEWKADKELQIVAVQAIIDSLGRHEADQILDALGKVDSEHIEEIYLFEEAGEEEWVEAQTYVAGLVKDWTRLVTALRDAIAAPAPEDPQQLYMKVLQIWERCKKDPEANSGLDTEDGCEARAHAICGLLVAGNVDEGRVHKRWVQRKEGAGAICLEHNRWNQHVAAAVQLDGQEIVLDPVFDPQNVMTYDAWKSKFVDGTSKFSGKMSRNIMQRPEF